MHLNLKTQQRLPVPALAAFQSLLESSGDREISTTMAFVRVLATLLRDKQIGRRIDESSPLCDARLPDGSRVNAVIHPLAIGGPFLTIRKFSKDPFQIDDLIRFGTLNAASARFLQGMVVGKLLGVE